MSVFQFIHDRPPFLNDKMTKQIWKEIMASAWAYSIPSIKSDAPKKLKLSCSIRAVLLSKRRSFTQLVHQSKHRLFSVLHIDRDYHGQAQLLPSALSMSNTVRWQVWCHVTIPSHIRMVHAANVLVSPKERYRVQKFLFLNFIIKRTPYCYYSPHRHYTPCSKLTINNRFEARLSFVSIVWSYIWRHRLNTRRQNIS